MFGISTQAELKRLTVEGVGAEMSFMAQKSEALVQQVTAMNQNPMLRCFHVRGNFVSAPTQNGAQIDILDEFASALVQIMIDPSGAESYYTQKTGSDVKVCYTDADVARLITEGYRKKTVTRSGKTYTCMRCTLCGAEEQLEEKMDMVAFLNDYIRVMNQAQRMYRQINYWRLQSNLKSNESGPEMYTAIYGKKGQMKLYSKGLFALYMQTEITNAKFQIAELTGVGTNSEDDSFAGGTVIATPDVKPVNFYGDMGNVKQGNQLFNVQYGQPAANVKKNFTTAPANAGAAPAGKIVR